MLPSGKQSQTIAATQREINIIDSPGQCQY